MYGQYGFDSITSNVALQSLIVGYLVGIATFPLATRASARIEKERGEGCPEAKLWWAKCVDRRVDSADHADTAAFCSRFRSTSSRRRQGHRYPGSSASLDSAYVRSAPVDHADRAVGASSHILFIVISDYTVLSYGHYAGSAVTGQSFAREIMAASLALVGETFCACHEAIAL